MDSRIECPFGLWDSPVSAMMLAGSRRLDGVRYSGDGKTIVWLEGRSGQGVLVAQSSPHEAPRDLTSGLSVRAEVGYGGGDFTVQGDTAFFVAHKSGRIFRQSLHSGPAKAITPAFGHAASPVVSSDGRFVAYVHTYEDVDRLAIVPADGSAWPGITVQGHDFYMQPRFSPDGRCLAWIAWDHPNMPWDGTTLFVAALEDTALGTPRVGEPVAIAGGRDTAIFQPEFSPDGRAVFYVSDESGWGRIYRHDLQTGERSAITPDGVECGMPAWVQDQRTYAVGADGRWLVVAESDRGVVHLRQYDLTTGESWSADGLEAFGEIGQVVASPHQPHVAFIGSGPAQSPQIVEYSFKTGQKRVVARASGETLARESLATCEPLSWTTAGGETAHGLLYLPHNPRFAGRGKPPLIAMIHGGPTSQARAGWRSDAQYFATRGWAVLYVNYRGSTGYGRPYMLRLRGNWGICDVEDSVSGAQHLAQHGVVDGERMVIMGGSAGGFTVLQTMVRQGDLFAAGVSLYGVADQFHLAAETHKFESRYLDSMLGPLPEAAPIYRERSPLFHAHAIRRPLAVFQGDIDLVVPRAQSDMIVAALAKTGTPHEYHVYEGEGHGWRKQETIDHFYRAVDSFLRREVLLK